MCGVERVLQYNLSYLNYGMKCQIIRIFGNRGLSLFNIVRIVGCLVNCVWFELIQELNDLCQVNNITISYFLFFQSLGNLEQRMLKQMATFIMSSHSATALIVCF